MYRKQRGEGQEMDVNQTEKAQRDHYKRDRDSRGWRGRGPAERGLSKGKVAHKVVDDADACKGRLVPIRADADHLTVNCHHRGESRPCAERPGSCCTCFRLSLLHRLRYLHPWHRGTLRGHACLRGCCRGHGGRGIQLREKTGASRDGDGTLAGRFLAPICFRSAAQLEPAGAAVLTSPPCGSQGRRR